MSLMPKTRRCPIHRRYDCCGREPKRALEQTKGWTLVRSGVWRIEDEHHPRGFRERRSKSAMRDLVDKKIVEQDGKCSLCGEPFTDRREVGPDHTDPRGVGGAFRDDHESNITAAHHSCNGEKGSQRVA